jgi:predicted transcriptional regulator
MDENEHCRLCRVLHESAAEKPGWKRWKQDYVCPGLRFDQAGRTVGHEDGHPLAVKERTGSGERAKR